MHRMYIPAEGDSLRQGDIIDREGLLPALRGHQDYIAWRKDFVGFCVVTQTCDLIADRSVEFIHLSVIRDLLRVFAVADTRPAAKDRMRRLLRDVLGQEYNKRGFFYLHAESSAGIGETCVVDLRTMFCLHEQHYKEIRSARKLSMNDAVANKLGWMAGQLFSRVPTPDWVTTFNIDNEIEQLLDKIKETPKLGADEVVMPPLTCPLSDPNCALSEPIAETGSSL
jgi:hypothetical protein